MEVLMAEDNPSPEIESQIAQLTERLSYLELAVREQLGRLHAIERRVGLASPPAKTVPYERLYPVASDKPENTRKGPESALSTQPRPVESAPIVAPPTAIGSDDLP